MSQEELFENYMLLLKKGGLPVTVGMILTNQQVDEIKAVLDKRKNDIDVYFEGAVMSRVPTIK